MEGGIVFRKPGLQRKGKFTIIRQRTQPQLIERGSGTATVPKYRQQSKTTLPSLPNPTHLFSSLTCSRPSSICLCMPTGSYT